MRRSAQFVAQVRHPLPLLRHKRTEEKRAVRTMYHDNGEKAEDIASHFGRHGSAIWMAKPQGELRYNTGMKVACTMLKPKGGHFDESQKKKAPKKK